MTQLAIDFEADIARDIERLKTLAGQLALKAGRHGCTVSDLRIAAVNAGVLTGQESAGRMKRLNLAAIMRDAGLRATEGYRRSVVPRSHSNLHRVWVIPEFQPPQSQEAGAA